jgi:hypothetical protein
MFVALHRTPKRLAPLFYGTVWSSVEPGSRVRELGAEAASARACWYWRRLLANVARRGDFGVDVQ